MTREEIKDFIFDVLGDVADPDAFDIMEHDDKFMVILEYPGLVHVGKQLLWDEWERGVELQPKFKDVKLFLPSDML